MRRELTVRWERFPLYSRTRKGLLHLGKVFETSSSWAPWQKNVYAVCARDGRPLYVGKAAGPKRKGFDWRYAATWGNGPMLSALAYGSANSLRIGLIEGNRSISTYATLEKELIRREAAATDCVYPVFNDKEKQNEPDWGIRIRHLGAAPAFHLRNSRRSGPKGVPP